MGPDSGCHLPLQGSDHLLSDLDRIWDRIWDIMEARKQADPGSVGPERAQAASQHS